MITEAEIEEEIVKDTIEISDPFAQLRMEIQHLPIKKQYQILLTEKRNIYQREIEAKIKDEKLNGNVGIANKLQHRLDKWVKNGRQLSITIPKRIKAD